MKKTILAVLLSCFGILATAQSDSARLEQIQNKVNSLDKSIQNTNSVIQRAGYQLRDAGKHAVYSWILGTVGGLSIGKGIVLLAAGSTTGAMLIVGGTVIGIYAIVHAAKTLIYIYKKIPDTLETVGK